MWCVYVRSIIKLWVEFFNLKNNKYIFKKFIDNFFSLQAAWRKSGDPLGIPALPPKPQYGAASAVPQSQTRPITSGSEFSDDDDHEIELSQNMNPSDEKRVRRYGTLALSFKGSCI
jgi:hypothetical protein